MYELPLAGVPPLAIAEREPLFSPKHCTSVATKETSKESGLIIGIFNVAKHPLSI